MNWMHHASAFCTVQVKHSYVASIQISNPSQSCQHDHAMHDGCTRHATFLVRSCDRERHLAYPDCPTEESVPGTR